jgi:DNA-binding GntR family transcriptional regulator
MIKLAKIPNLTELTYRSIKQNLLDGTLGELSRLTEESLATQLGISKSPVREALNRLEAEGLVCIEPRRGAYVRQFSAKEIRDLYELREILEVHSIEAAHVTPKLLSDLAASINRTKKFLKEGNKLEHIEALPRPRKHSAKDSPLPVQILRALRDNCARRSHEDLPGSKEGLQTRGAARHA